MVVPATFEDKRFVFLKDIDGNDAPIFIGPIVTAINSGAVPGFAALNSKDQEFLETILADAEHHHRVRLMHSPDSPKNWEYEGEIEKRMRNLRLRLNLPMHAESPDHCPYLRHENSTSERIGL